MILPSEADTTTISTIITKDTGRADLERMEGLRELMLVEGARDVGYIEIGVLLIRELLQL